MGEQLETAYGYVRVSSVGQEEGDGPKRQREQILGYAQGNGLKVLGFYEDSISGIKEDRPELGRMLYDLERPESPRVVIIESLSRLARDLLVSEVIIRDFKVLDVSLISVQEGQDLGSNDPNRTLVRQLLGAIAQFDRSMLVWKLRAARDRKSAELGRRVEGRKPVYPEFLREYAWQMRLNGHTYQSIADRINGMGVKTSTNGCFYPQLIRTMLSH